MAWVLFDDQYPIHRKVAGLSDTAFRLHSAAIFWCRRNGTDGFVPEEDLDQVCAQVRTPARFAAECVRRGTWHPADHACTSEACPVPRPEPGWVIHDYLEYQPTKDESETARRKQQEQKSTGGKLGNHRRWHAARGVTDPGCPWCAETPPSVSDRYPIGASDRTPIAPSLSHLSVVDVGNQSSRRNPRTDQIQHPLMTAIDGLADEITHVLDDDDLLKAVIDSIHQRTRRVIAATKARSIAASILGAARYHVDNPAPYVTKAILGEPDPVTRWLASSDTGHVTPSPREPWCRQCSDEIKRQVEDAEGRPRRCPNCHPLREVS